jgi:TPR repeat protein
MYLRGEGIARNEARGLELLRISADKGCTVARYLLGQRYYYGTGVIRDDGRAKTLLQAAAAEGDYRAALLLKIMAQGSRGEKMDRESIVATVKRKARSKDAEAQYALGFMYLTGDGVPKYGAEELRWYRAAAAENANAAFMLSLLHRSGDGVSYNPAESFRLMRRSAEKGHTQAQYYLGTYYYQGVGTQVDHQSAAAWFRRAAENGFADAQLAYGLLLLSGDGVALDRSQAIEWLGKASRQNNGRAKEELKGLLTYHGQPAVSPMKEGVTSAYSAGKQQNENQLRLEGSGVILDQGTFGLKFSLPSLNDAYAPQNRPVAQPMWGKLPGGTFDIIIRPPR